MKRKHTGQHDSDCYGCKLATIQFGNVEAPPQRASEHLWGADRDAYARFRQEGIQPKSIRHCAQLEAKANTAREIEMGHLMKPSLWRKIGPMIEDAEATVRIAATKPNSDTAKEMGEKVRAYAKERAA